MSGEQTFSVAQQTPPGTKAARFLRAAAIAYALIPLLAAGTWFLVGDLGGVRFRAPIDLLIFLELGVILAALSCGMMRNFRPRLTRPERAALLVLVAVFAWGAAVAAPHPGAALDGILMRLTHLLFALALCYLVGLAGPGPALGMTGAVAAQPLLHLPVLAAAYVLLFPEPQAWFGGPLGFWHVRIWGVALGAAIMAALGLYAARDSGEGRERLAAFAVFCLLWAMLFWSGSRGTIVGVTAGTLVSLALFPRSFLPRMPVFLGAAAAGALLSLLLADPHPAYGFLNVVDKAARVTSLDDLSSSRLEIWQATLQKIAERPLLGHGHDQFAHLDDGLGSGHLQPHNAVLNLLLDFGVIGGGAAMFLLLSMWWRGVKLARAGEGWRLGALTMLTALAGAAMFDGVLYFNEPLGLVAIGYAVALARPAPGRGSASL